VILTVCIAIAGSWKLLVEDHQSARGADEYLDGAIEAKSSGGFKENSFVDQSSVTARLRTYSPAANSDVSEARRDLPNQGLSRERFNAALAAGLIDPSRIEFVEPVVPALSPTRERATSQSGPMVTIQNPARGKESGAPPMNVAVAKPATSTTTNQTKPIDVVSPQAPATDKIVSAPTRQSAEAEPDGRMPASHHRDNHRENLSPRNKQLSVRFVATSRISSPGTSSAEESMSRNNSSANTAKPESSTGRRTDVHDSQSPDLSENLQRFASDFVRANQTDNVAEQNRFFADSVHFYGEGDLSLASVATATRRHHRDQQTKRSEVAEPAAATGPVNGGFFVIEQPVRWTQSQGSKVTQGRSVLRLRVVPINHGGWKITSIDEVNK
jgi:hypothetical protein